MAHIERAALWLVVLFACVFAYCEHGKHEHRLWRLEGEFDYEKREACRKDYLESIFWKPKLWELIVREGLDKPGEWSEDVDNARQNSFPEGWEEKDRERRTLAMEY